MLRGSGNGSVGIGGIGAATNAAHRAIISSIALDILGGPSTTSGDLLAFRIGGGDLLDLRLAGDMLDFRGMGGGDLLDFRIGRGDLLNLRLDGGDLLDLRMGGGEGALRMGGGEGALSGGGAGGRSLLKLTRRFLERGDGERAARAGGSLLRLLRRFLLGFSSTGRSLLLLALPFLPTSSKSFFDDFFSLRSLFKGRGDGLSTFFLRSSGAAGGGAGALSPSTKQARMCSLFA